MVEPMLNILPLLVTLALSQATEEEDLREVISQLQQRGSARNSTTTRPTDAVETCVTENDEPGECVPYYQCNNNGSVSTDGEGLLDFRANGCSSWLDVCCRTADSRRVNATVNSTTTTTEIPDTSTTTTTSDEVESCVLGSGAPGQCVPRRRCAGATFDYRAQACTSPSDVCCRPSGCLRPVEPVKPKEGCGWRNRDGVAGVPGETEFGEFPWMVAIFKLTDSEPPQRIYAGGGSLIHLGVVLTAAHILGNSSAAGLLVRAGEWDLQTESEPYPHQDRDVASVVVHQEFTRRNLYYDIALLFLAEPVSSAPNVGVACLPPAPAPGAAVTPAPRGPCLASGWGKKKFGREGTYQTVLKSVEVPLVDRQRCTRLLRETRLGRYFVLHHSFMCAGERDRDTCTGDGGSPLVCPTETPGRYVQHGVVSWGVGCAGAAPGVYAALAARALRGWLGAQLARRGLEPAGYTD